MIDILDALLLRMQATRAFDATSEPDQSSRRLFYEISKISIDTREMLLSVTMRAVQELFNVG